MRARAAGNVPLSRDLTNVAGLAAGTLALMLSGVAAADSFARPLVGFWSNLAGWDAAGPAPWRTAASAVLEGAAPVALAVLFAGCTVALLQTGFALRPFAPDLRRVSPLAGVRRLFSPDHLVDSGKAVVKLIVLGVGLWHLMRAHLASAALALDWTPNGLLAAIRDDVVELLLYLIAAQAAITVLDILWVRLRFAGTMRMSRTDVRQEHRETEGDPQIKARLRQIRRARMRRRMMAAVPKATLVVTNPTHYAVALAYEKGQAGAPRVVAKGVDEVALRIRAVAQAHRVPIAPRPALARALYTVELDAEIPTAHFKLVAELIAYFWRLEKRVGRSL